MPQTGSGTTDRRGRRLSLTLAWALIGGALAAPLHAQEADFLATLKADNTLRVECTLALPPGYPGVFPISAAGLDSIESIRVDTMTPAGASPLAFSTVRSGPSLLVMWDPLLNSTNPCRLAYTLVGPVTHRADSDQLQWSVLGADQGIAFTRVQVLLGIPGRDEDTLGTRKPAVRTSASETRWSIANGRIRIEAVDVPPHSVLSVDMRLPKGMVVSTFHFNKFMKTGGGTFFMVAIPAVVLACLSLLFWFRGRDPRLHVRAGSVSRPTRGMTPEIAGTLVDEYTEPRDLLAALVDIARKGMIQLRYVPAQGEGVPEVHVVPVRPFDELPPSQLAVANMMTRTGTHAPPTFSIEQGVHRGDVRAAQAATQAECAQRGYFRKSPHAERHLYYVVGAVLVVLGIAVGAGAPAAFWMAKVGWGLILTAAAFFVFARAMPQRTWRGALEKQELLAFDAHLQATDPATMNPSARQDDFESGLPYAIAFRYRKEWINRFTEAGVRTPAWWRMDSAAPTAEPTPLLETRELFIQTLSILAAALGESPARNSGG